MARGRSKQYWMCGVAALSISWGAYGTPVMAADFTIPSGTTETTPQTLASGEIGIIESGGTLSTAGATAITGVDNNEITNDGTLTTAGGGAFGILVNDGNTITNNGTLVTNGPGSSGVVMGSNNVLTNTGTIATTDPGGNFAILGTNNNTIVSSGSISKAGGGPPVIFLDDGNTIEISGSIDSDGFVIDAGDNNTVDISGTITTTGTGPPVMLVVDNNQIDVSGTINAGDRGAMFFGDNNTVDVSGTIVGAGIGSPPISGGNNNDISVSGSLTTNQTTGFGIFAVHDNRIDVSGSIQTQGDFSHTILIGDRNTVEVSGDLTTTGFRSEAIFFRDNNTIDVSGTISTSGFDSDGLFGDNNNTVTVSGVIRTTDEDADGIDVNDGNFVNVSGVIVTSGPGSADAIEIDDNSTVINSGILVATGGPFANGIDGESNSRVFNLGTVISSQGSGMDFTAGGGGAFVANSGVVRGGNGTSIDFGPGADGLFIANGSVLDGIVDFDAGASSIFFQTGNQTISSTGTTPTVTSAADVFFVQNGDTATSLDQDLLGISELNYAFLDQSHRIHRAISNHVGTDTLSQIAARSQEVQVASNDDGVYSNNRRSRAFWASFYGGFADRDDDSQIPDSRHEFWGGIAGARLKQHEGASFGLFGGYGSSRIDSNDERTTAEVDRFFGGLYSAFPMGRWAMTTNVFGGAAQTDSVRNIANNTSPGGLDAARAEIDSFFVGAGFETARVFDQAIGDFGLRPSGGIRYAGEWSDGYTETGALAALTVSDRTAHAMSGFAELALVNTYDHIQVDFGLGAEGRAIFGDDSVNVTLLATPFTVTPEDNDGSVDGYARLGLKGSVTERLSLFLDLEGRTGSDVDVGASAQTGLNLLF